MNRDEINTEPPPVMRERITITFDEHRRYVVAELALRAGCDLTDEQRQFIREMRQRFLVEA